MNHLSVYSVFHLRIATKELPQRGSMCQQNSLNSVYVCITEMKVIINNCTFQYKVCDKSTEFHLQNPTNRQNSTPYDDNEKGAEKQVPDKNIERKTDENQMISARRWSEVRFHALSGL